MIYEVIDKDKGIRYIQMVPMDKYPLAEPQWMLIQRYLAGQYHLFACDNEDGSVGGVLLCSMSGGIVWVALLWAPHNTKKYWERFKEELRPYGKRFRFFTDHPKAWGRILGAKPLYTVVEVEG
jgi:hypothetical protein